MMKSCPQSWGGHLQEKIHFSNLTQYSSFLEDIEELLSYPNVFLATICIRHDRTSLVVQCPRLCLPNKGGLDSIPGQGTRSHMLQLRVCMLQKKTEDPSATTRIQHSQINKSGYPSLKVYPILESPHHPDLEKETLKFSTEIKNM